MNRDTKFILGICFCITISTAVFGGLGWYVVLHQQDGPEPANVRIQVEGTCDVINEN